MGFFFENDDGDMYDYIPGDYIYGDGVYTPDEYMDEKWWYIDEAPGYMISNYGRIWSEKSQWFVKPKIMDREGHMGVCLYVNKKPRYFYVHRLIAKAFIPNPNDYPIVRHLNDVPDDNGVRNLCWGTQRDNAYDALRNGRTFRADPEILDGALDSVRTPVLATNLKTGEEFAFRGQSEAARALGLHQANIWKVLNGQRAHTKSWFFEYLEQEEYHERNIERVPRV